MSKCINCKCETKTAITNKDGSYKEYLCEDCSEFLRGLLNKYFKK